MPGATATTQQGISCAVIGRQSYVQSRWGDHGWLNPHPEYLRLGLTSADRGHAYRELFKAQLIDKDLHLIRKAAHCCRPIGDDRFRQQTEQQYSIQLGRMERGRLRKETDKQRKRVVFELLE